MNEGRRRAHLELAAVVSGVIALAILLRRFPPEQYGVYPRCPIFEWTGLLCPGCGATRALASLAHGNLAEALHWNALVVMLLPVFVAWGVVVYRRALSGEGTTWPKLPNYGVMALLVVAAVFVIVRNIVGFV